MGSKNVSIALIIVAAIVFVNMEMARESISAIRTSVLMSTFESEVVSTNIRGSDVADQKVDVAVPKFQVSSLFSDEHARIDNEDAATRCDRYNLKPYDGPPRRIFYGALVADENWEIHVIHAIEVYNIYHSVAFVECNTTFMATPRPLRYKDSREGDQLTRSGMFGPKTNVYIDYWLEDKPDLISMDREAEQRSTIIKRWKDAGMRPDDVGLLSDADEIVSRDFLRAVQTCDLPELQPDQSCHSPKIIPSCIPFESSPYCVNKKQWFHPDLMSGQCVEGIGDPTERIVPLRAHNRRYGERHQLYGKQHNSQFPEEVHKSGRYPLFNGEDIRSVHGDKGLLYNIKESLRDTTAAVSVYGAAYHLHNWFADGRVIRNKYRTYSHEVNDKDMTISQISGDLDMAVRCVKGLDNEANPYNWAGPFHLEGRNVVGTKPIFFLNTTYAEERHKLLAEMVLQDEATHGTSYNSNGTWIENSLYDEERRKQAIDYRNDSIRPEVLKRKQLEIKSEEAKVEPAVAGVAEETTSDAMQSEAKDEAAPSNLNVSSAVKYPERK